MKMKLHIVLSISEHTRDGYRFNCYDSHDWDLFKDDPLYLKVDEVEVDLSEHTQFLVSGGSVRADQLREAFVAKEVATRNLLRDFESKFLLLSQDVA
jgi:hypothetical protein|tara:strand:- start:295 stop:585 length:291 start_codon:yes stop_codon:yes gene_type:complete